MILSIKDEKFSISVDGSRDFCSEIARTVFYFQGVTDWKEPNHADGYSESDFSKQLLISHRAEVEKTIPALKQFVIIEKKHGRPPKNQIKNNISQTELYCSHCNKIKPVDEFHKSKNSSTGHQSYCKTCRSEINKGKEQREELEPVEIVLGTDANVNQIKILRYIENKQTFDIKEFLAANKDISQSDAEEMIRRLIEKHKIVQLSNTKFRVVS